MRDFKRCEHHTLMLLVFMSTSASASSSSSSLLLSSSLSSSLCGQGRRRRRCRRRCAARARASSASCEQDTPAFPLCVIGAVLTPFCVLLLTRPIFIGPQQPPPGADQTTNKTTAVYVSAPQHPHCSLWATRLSGWQIILRLMRTLQSDRTQAAAPHSVWECASA